jgi:glycosyltransferase involved in cell wall biosynthesis
MDIHRPQLFQRDPGLTGPAIPAILVKARADEEKWVWISNPLTSVGPVDDAFSRGSDGALATVSVIIPTLNEAGNLPYVLNTIPRWVDDGRSDDDTERVAKVLWPDVRIVHQGRPGKGAAMRAGLQAAKGDILIVLDADGSMDGAEIGAFRDALQAGADFAKGSRFCPGGGSADITNFRRMGDGGICLLIRLLFGARCTDATYGFIGVWADRLNWIDIDTDGFEVETLINIRVHRAGLRTVEIPCFEAHRIHGNSNLHAIRDGFRILSVIVRERFRRYRVPAS